MTSPFPESHKFLMTLGGLPPELALSILSYLPFKPLGDISLVCRRWNKFCQVHENPIYHQAALLHGYVSSTGTSINDACKFYSERSIGCVDGWKDLCRKRRWIERNWSGTGPSQITTHHSTGKDVHRIKVDEKAGYIITTSSTGGLQVTDLREDRELWSLPDSHVRPYAHCEYGEGFVIWDYLDGSKEVWRRVEDWNEEEAALVIPEAMPTPRLRRVYGVAAEKYDTENAKSTRGHFRPWAVLRPPQPTRAFRFSYPTLGAAGWDNIYLWDVRTGALVQTIEQTQLGIQHDDGHEHEHESSQLTAVPALDFLGDINYIEVSEKYVFLCGIRSLRAFSRATGRFVLDVSSSKHPLAGWHLSLSPTRSGSSSLWKDSSLVSQNVVCRRITMPDTLDVLLDEFVAVHISPCGKHLAGLMMSSRLILIHDFEKALQPNVKTFDLALEIQLGSPCLSSIYLAFENNRIAVVTRSGVYVVQPDWSTLSNGNDSPPIVSVMRVPALGDRSCLGVVSCLQMTDTGLFLNWDPDFLPMNLSDEAVQDMEDRFHDSLTDERRTANVANGLSVTLVDLEVPEFDPDSSTVLSVDFMSCPSFDTAKV